MPSAAVTVSRRQPSESKSSRRYARLCSRRCGTSLSLMTACCVSAPTPSCVYCAAREFTLLKRLKRNDCLCRQSCRLGKECKPASCPLPKLVPRVGIEPTRCHHHQILSGTEGSRALYTSTICIVRQRPNPINWHIFKHSQHRPGTKLAQRFILRQLTCSGFEKANSEGC